MPLLTICSTMPSRVDADVEGLNIFWNSSQPSFSGTSSCSSPSSGWVAHCSYQDSVVIFVGSSSWVTKQSTHTHQPGGSRAACDTSDLYERYVDAMFRQCSLPLCRLMRNEAQNQMTHVPRCLTDIDIRFDWLRTPVTHQTPSQLQAILSHSSASVTNSCRFWCPMCPLPTLPVCMRQRTPQCICPSLSPCLLNVAVSDSVHPFPVSLSSHSRRQWSTKGMRSAM